MNLTTVPTVLPLAWLDQPKLFRVMKLSIFLLFFTIFQANAKVYSQVTLDEKDVPLEQVLRKIEQQTSYTFIYDESKLKVPHLTVNVKNVPVEKALTACFRGMPVSFSIVGNNIILKPSVSRISSEIITADADPVPVQVKGVIIDSAGNPLSRATVFFVKQKKHTTEESAGDYTISYVTADDGMFTMDAEEGDQLGVSFVGYKLYKFKVTRGLPFQTIVLHRIVSQLNEVIIQTGYQVLSKNTATGSYAKPDMKTFHSRAASMDIVSRLDGLVPGLTIIGGTSGQGGNEFQTGSNQQSVLRGKSSLRISSEPLYVVDGVQVPNLSNINPNDVKDITVLKDAAASAIYGAKAANGVIVIVTKSGAKNQKIEVNYSGYVSFQGKPHVRKGLYMSSPEYIATARELFDPAQYPFNSLSNSFIAPHEQILYDQEQGLITAAAAEKSLDSLSGISNKKQIMDLFYRNALTTNHTLSVSGGANMYSFYTSLSYTNTEGNVPGTSNNEYRISFNQTISPAKWISISLATGLNNNHSTGKKPISVSEGFLPYQLFRDNNGQNIRMNYVQGLSAETRADYQARSRLDLNYTPLDETGRGYSKRNLFTVSNTAGVELKLFKGLSFNGTYGYQKSAGNYNSYTDHSSYDLRQELLNFTVADDPSVTPVYYLPTSGGRLMTNDIDTYNWTVRNQLVYNTAFRNNKDHLNIQVGQEAVEQSNSLSTSMLRGYDDVLKTYALLDYATLAQPIFGTIGSGYSVFSEKPYDITIQKTRFSSYFGLFSYSFDDKYTLYSSVRSDRSSLFASTQSGQQRPAYSVGVKWLLSNEHFMSGVQWLDNLGLRFTYGISGNSPYVGAGSIVDVLGVNINPNTGNSLTLNTPANNKLNWESTHTLNIGMDFSVLKSGLSGSIDMYHKNTTNLLGAVHYNPLNGVEGSTGNIGNIRNSGIEFSLQSQNIQGGKFQWSTGFVFSYNINKLISYSLPEQYSQTAEAWMYSDFQIGYAVPSVFAYKYAGLDNMGDPQIRLADGKITKERDVAATTDLVYMGSTLPKFNGGLSNRFTYQGFSLSANMIYNIGAVLRRNANNFFNGRQTGSAGSFSGNLLSEFGQRWKGPGDEAFTNVPSFEGDGYNNYFRRNTDYYTFADINVIDASFIKLRDITFSYDIPAVLLKRLRMARISVFVQGGNFMIWKANKYGIDPEYEGLDRGGRNYSTGLNVTF